MTTSPRTPTRYAVTSARPTSPASQMLLTFTVTLPCISISPCLPVVFGRWDGAEPCAVPSGTGRGDQQVLPLHGAVVRSEPPAELDEVRVQDDDLVGVEPEVAVDGDGRSVVLLE